MYRTVITGTGCFIPDEIKTNKDFGIHEFYSEDNKKISIPSEEITRKFQDITGIEERRYASPEHTASDLAFFASEKAIVDAGIDRETLDQIIFAHNYGDVPKHNIQTDAVPSLASRLKHKLGILNPSCIA
jgi:3-oxoacyl-[acyl-carrier-protein] synthase-3